MMLSDKDLGLNRPITRRDILHGFGSAAASTFAPSLSLANQLSTLDSAPSYPPALRGIRGNHDGAFEPSHKMGLEGQTDWGPVKDAEDPRYDVIIVGAGISGLSAAHFFRKENPNARILILDNHDDFGGHAKRNEFSANGRTLIGYGGSQTLQEPSSYPDIAKVLLDDLGVDISKFNSAYDQGFYERNNLRGGLHFNKDDWGVDRIVPADLGFFENYIPVAKSELSVDDAVAQMPLSEKAKKELLYLVTTEKDHIPHIQGDDKWAFLQRISYRDFIAKHVGVSDPDVYKLLQDLPSDSGVGIDAANALSAITYSGLPGWDAAGLPDEDEEVEPYIHHFPDGNASIARLIVRQLIPDVAAGDTMEDLVTAMFDYSKLDQASADVRLRLNSTAIRAEHNGDAKTSDDVSITYIKDNKATRVTARSCILACNNASIPYMCPELSEGQHGALAYQVRSPILYTSVALRNWRPWKALGIGTVQSPGSYHIHSMLDFPVSLGNYTYAQTPDDPIILHMERFPHVNNQGLTAQEQFRAGRYELLSTPFDTIERNIRTQLTSMLGSAGFDPAADILGITCNRWAHGYAYFYNPLFDTVYENRNDERMPHMRARQQYYRISIASTDSAARPMLEAAVEQGHRAAMEQMNA